MSRRLGLLMLFALSALPARAQLTSRGSQLWHQGSAGVGSDPEAHDRFGSALATGDFDGDGRADLAVGVPGEDILGAEDAGVVHVLYGGSGGFSADAMQYWAQASGMTPAVVGANYEFGATLAAGDFNGDGRDDLAIGTPGQALAGEPDAGGVIVLYGSANGLTDQGSQHWTQSVFAPATLSEPGDLFGAALAAGDFDGDGRDDLAIGSPGESMGWGVGVGIVHVLRGSLHGLAFGGHQQWYQDKTGVPGSGQSNARFGEALSAADFNGDGRADLAIGSPNTTVGQWPGAGAVTVLYGSPAGLSTTGAWFFHRDTAGVPGSPGPGIRFGRTLATGDFDGDGHADLVVGAPLDGFGAALSGTFNVLYGAWFGLTTGGTLWHQGMSPTGQNEQRDQFAWSLATGDFDGDGHDDLAVGAIGKAVGSADEAGMVRAFYGGDSGLGVDSQPWTQDSVNPDPVPGAAEWGDHFGRSLAAGDFDGDGTSDLAVGVPLEGVGSVPNAGSVNILPGNTGMRKAP